LQAKLKKKTTLVRSYADSTFLPFSLRLCNTFLPPAVLILFIKPCTFFLCLFFGWYVRIISNTSVSRQKYSNLKVYAYQ
jgi:hypothetical protein